MKLIVGKNGFTLLEMSLVIMILMALLGTGLFVSSKYSEWQLGRAASEDLRSVYAAQRMYFADHPTAVATNLTDALLIPYLANRAAAIPTVEDLDKNMRQIVVNVSPPFVDNGAGERYDPSGSFTDSLWDVGE